MSYSFVRALKTALQDFWRNIWLSIVTLTVLVLALLSVNILISFNALSQQVVNTVQDKVDVSVFFKSEITQAQINLFQDKIQKMVGVKETVFVPKASALADFKKKHKDEPKILEALQAVGANPLSDALVIKADNPEDYYKILAVLGLAENQALIKYQNFTDHKKIIERVQSISDKVQTVSLSLTGIFVFIAGLIVFNSIRVTIYIHRREIGVMRLVGATNWFIRAPFLLGGVLYGIFACAIAIGILYLVFGAAGPYITTFTESYNFNIINYYNQNFIWIFPAELGAVILLNIISGGIAIGRYLKV